MGGAGLAKSLGALYMKVKLWTEGAFMYYFFLLIVL